MGVKGLRCVWVHESLRAEALGRLRRQSVVSGRVDHMLHYVSTRQAQLWMEVHRKHAPLFEDAAFGRIFQDCARELGGELVGRAVHVLGLGAGGGAKEAIVLGQLKAAGCELRYTPVDASMELAIGSAEAAFAGEPGLVEPERVQPVVADLRALQAVVDALDAEEPGTVRVYTAFGLAPNFEPEEFLGLIRAVLRPGDVLLLSANLAPVACGEEGEPEAVRVACERILPQYANAETGEWLRQVLVDWGAGEWAGPVEFGLGAVGGVPAVRARCRWERGGELVVEGVPLRVDAGGVVELFFSLRYTPGILAAVLGKHGMELGRGYLTPNGEEGVWRVWVAR